MKKRQVFVRAQDSTGKWGCADVLDLDDISFRAFVIDILFKIRAVVGILDEHVEEAPISYRTKEGIVFSEDD